VSNVFTSVNNKKQFISVIVSKIEIKFMDHESVAVICEFVSNVALSFSWHEDFSTDYLVFLFRQKSMYVDTNVCTTNGFINSRLIIFIQMFINL